MQLSKYFLLCALLAATAGPALGQRVFTPVDDIDFDEPEAWALKFFSSVSLLTSLGPVVPLEKGSVEGIAEIGQIPYLDEEQRTVGFSGLKEEDLNRSPVFARFRIRVGLPAGVGLTVGWAPPLEVQGIESNFVSLGLEKSLAQRGPWGLGLRVYGQVGEADGDLTCASDGDLRFPPGSPENRFGCTEPSNDTVRLGYYGAELVGSYAFGRGPVLHFGVAANHFDLEFQVRAQLGRNRDLSLLRTDGDTLSYTAGLTISLGRLGLVTGEAFYSPLDVVRNGVLENDPVVNFRAAYRIRLN